MNKVKKDIVFTVRLIALCALIALLTRGLSGLKNLNKDKTPTQTEVRNNL